MGFDEAIDENQHGTIGLHASEKVVRPERENALVPQERPRNRPHGGRPADPLSSRRWWCSARQVFGLAVVGCAPDDLLQVKAPFGSGRRRSDARHLSGRRRLAEVKRPSAGSMMLICAESVGPAFGKDLLFRES